MGNEAVPVARPSFLRTILRRHELIDELTIHVTVAA